MFNLKRILPVLFYVVTRVLAANFFYKSHDLSSIRMLENGGGAVFYDIQRGNVSRPLEDILKDGGMNTIKLRLFVTETGPYTLEYTLALAKRFVVQAGFRFILNMHLSDTWADPGRQDTPEGWPTDPDALAATLRQYVSDTLSTFCAAGASPDIVTLGNEISRGMLWPTGQFDPLEEGLENRTRTFAGGFAPLWLAARKGVDDSVSNGSCTTRPQAALHLDAGWDTTLYSNIYTALFNTGIVAPEDLDVFGLTNYPYFGNQGTFANVQRNADWLVGNYSRNVHILETDWPVQCNGSTLAEGDSPPELSEKSIPLSPEGQIQWVGNLTDVMRNLPNGLGQGISYWEGAWLNYTNLGNGGCDDLLLFDQAYFNESKPNHVGYSRESVNMFKY